MNDACYEDGDCELMLTVAGAFSHSLPDPEKNKKALRSARNCCPVNTCQRSRSVRIYDQIVNVMSFC